MLTTRRSCFALLPLLCGAAIASAQSSFTLEQVMSSPFPYGLVAAAHANRVAWVFDARGVRNVWVADGPDFARTARQVTHYSADDGQPIASVRLTPDGKTALYVLGSELNGQQESANPASSTKGAKQQVFALDLADNGAAPRLLGDMGCPEEGCEDIEISPDGQQAVWAARRKLWLASVDGKQQAKELTSVRGTPVGPKWSPDGKHIAFTSVREGHSLICIYDFGGDAIRYMSPSVDKDSMVRWSPNGKFVVWVRTAGEENRLPLIPVRPEPWSLWVADTSTGAGHALWKSGSKLDDSLPELSEDVSLAFAEGDRVVFASEQDGRNHLYSIGPRGGAVLLTPGDFDVEDVMLSPDRTSVIYSSNQDDVDRRHLWRVAVIGGRPQQALTKGETMEWSPVETTDGKIVCLGSTATTPAMPYEIAGGSRDMIAKQALPGDFPSESLVTPRQVIFKSADGITLHGQLFLPRNATGKIPGLVFMHGGPIRQMMLGFHYMDYYHNAYAENQHLASHGYAVLSVNYRLGVMYGRAFREAPNTIWRGAAEYRDVLAAGRYLQALPQVDGQKIGLWGGSYGGFLTAMGLARNSDLFKAGVDFHGVHDWSMFLTQESFFGSLASRPPDEDAAVKLAWESSPDSSVATWKSPVLLIQGDDDRNVPFTQTIDLVQRLRAHQVPFEQLIFPDEIHGFLRWQDWIRAYGATLDFFDRTLKHGEKISTGN
ncbi:MAG TPA: prolyl oligopeptidase family serine peptidase [Bryobacteraceae bacterium]|jgi:dipeptidyl aminopeptidase/acylaminoacyl peptidase|nr:prolyl oligopeptidase family serine peptidase [Bryobacteraceae bacterium]